MAIDDSSQDSIYQADELLSPLSKMQKYMNSQNIFHRQMVVRSILETLRSVVDSSGDTTTVINIMCRLSDDGEPSVRAELMEQVPHIAMFCHEYRDRLFSIPSQYLLPIVIRYLCEQHNLVRKTSQAALLVLLEQDLLHKADVEDVVCPAILQLTATDNFDEFRTEGVALMSKMAPLIGREMTEKHFLRSFASLCMDTLFQVRKVCAANLGDFCQIVTVESAENILLPRFSYLCDDTIWGVRKACADVFTAVSYSCSTEIRRQELAPLFVNLLCDQSRWVRMAAFQALGPFISTYADPKHTGIYYTENGLQIRSERVDERTGDQTVVAPPKEDDCNRLLVPGEANSADELTEQASPSAAVSCGESGNLSNVQPNGADAHDKSEIPSSSCRDAGTKPSENGGSDEASSCVDEKSICSGIDGLLTSERSKPPLNVSTSSQGHLHLHVDNESAFNSFHFWRIPIPDIELDIDIVEGKPTNVHVKAKVHSEEHKRVYSSELSVQLSQSESCLTGSSARVDVQEIPSKNASTTTGDVAPKVECDSESNQTSSENTSSVIQTRIKTASVGTTQDNIAEGVVDTLATNVNETLVTIVNGEMTDVQWSQVNICVDSNDGNSTLYPSLLFETAAASSQNIVPCELLAHYINMSDPSLIQTVDTEITCHCAYSLPAVAMTLGKKNWPILRRLYETLAGDMQWKVRRTLAFSIHELANILGEDLSTQDLVPIFNGFIKDLDEVRIGVLRHLTDFLKFLGSRERQRYLPKLSEFLKTDNERNWRFRLELAEQLGSMADLFSPNEVRDYLIPIGILLVADKVAQVRQMALRKMSVLVKRLSFSDDPTLTKSFLVEIAENFAHHPKWIHRQTFASLCSHFVEEKSLSLAQFANDMLPHLLNLSYDPVPNVRISVASALSQSIIPQEYYQNPHQELLAEVMKRLQTDSDRDVRFYASLGSSKNVYSDESSVPTPLT